MRLTNNMIRRRELRARQPFGFRGQGTNVAFALAFTVLGWSLAGCGSSSSPVREDGSRSETGGVDGGRADTGPSGTGGTAAPGADGGTPTSLPDLGKACAGPADCTGGTTCLAATGKIILGTEAPANGYCSRSCTTDTDCAGSGICLDVSASGATTAVGYCFQTCTFGGPSGSVKCHGRTDVGCLTIDSMTTPTTDICYPVCSQDSDCPTGRKCDLSESLCADTAATGDPLGSHCTADPDGGASSCVGGCLPIGSAAGGNSVVANVCTMFCVVGNLNACNWVGSGTALTSGGAHGVCALASSNAQVGDIGFCSQECDTITDCSDKTDTGGTCDTSLMSTIGHGICSWG